MSDAEAVARVLGGDVDEFAELEQRYDHRVKACLFGMVGDPGVVDDLAHETWVQAFEKLSRYNPSRSFVEWVRGFARKLAWEQRRSWARHCDDLQVEDLPPGDEPTVPGPEEEFDARLGDAHVEALLASLPGLQAEAVRMRVCEGRSYAEMQALTGRTLTVLRNEVYHGVRRLRAEMRDKESDKEIKG